MGYAAFSIRRIARKKWKLFEGQATVGEFDSYEDAYDAMRFVIQPDVKYFSAEGDEIEAS
jgi:hypothetical protein